MSSHDDRADPPGRRGRKDKMMIIQADILSWAEAYEGEPFHALLCDAPYEMQFMGRDWDNTGIAFDPNTWKAVARHLYPGAFLFVFAGTINDDLISVAMRQAGLRKYHKAMAWGYGSGFPKATRLDVQIDRAAGAARQKVGTKKHQPKFDAKGFEYRKKDNGYNSKERESFDVTVPATDLAQTWAGHRYGGQMLKPALETILIFQKPYQGRPIDCITRTGAGALWIDGGRIGTEESWNGRDTGRGEAVAVNGDGLNSRSSGSDPAGRWPSNLILSHSEGCEPIGTRRVRASHTPGSGNYPPPNGYEGGWADRLPAQHYADPDGMGTVTAWSCAPDCPVRRLGEQSGESESKRSDRGRVEIFDELYKRAPSWHGESTERGHDDTGTAARFFFQADWMLDRLEQADPVAYSAKASRSEREAGLDPRQIALLGKEKQAEATINDGRAKAIDNPYQRGETTRRNTGPCIKPLSLTRYLATLLLPPAMYAPRRILCPFGGTGSEAIGAMLAGWEEAVYVEREAEYVAIAESRLAYWRQRRHELADPSKKIGAVLSEAPDGQLDMFGGDQ